MDSSILPPWWRSCYFNEILLGDYAVSLGYLKGEASLTNDLTSVVMVGGRILFSLEGDGVSPCCETM